MNNFGIKTGSADAVVCGGGIVGTSIAYHLGKAGKSIILLERDCVGCGGASGLSSGFVTAPLHWQDPAKQYMAKCSLDLYKDLARQSSFRLNQCGRLFLASTQASEISLKRMFSRRIIFNEQAELLEDPAYLKEKWPFLTSDDISLALFSPNDLCVDPIGLCRALSDRAREYGVHIIEECNVQEIMLGEENEIQAIFTNQGIIETDCFIDAGGIWCGTTYVKDLPTKRVKIAAYPATYTYLNTGPLIKNVENGSLPIFTHVDEKTMLYTDSKSTLCGAFSEESCRPLESYQYDTGEWVLPQTDWDLFYKPLQLLIARYRGLEDLTRGELVCNGESYTPDKNPVIGETSQVSGYYVASGFGGHGLAFAGGVGDIMADIICQKQPKIDVSKMEVTRFIDLHANPQYLSERVSEVADRLFTNSYEYHQYRTARKLRTSPIHHRLKEVGGIFGETMGYERALWFTGNPDDRESLYSGQFRLIGRPEWMDRVAKEYEALRERIGLVDLTSVAKFDIIGKDSVEFLQKICSANIDQPIGTTIYTGMQNESGGYVTDCTLSRLGPHEFFAVAPTIQQLRFKLWLEKWAKEWGTKIYINDVTGYYMALDIVGPSSRYLMQDLTRQSMTLSDFPPFAIRVVNIGIATGIRAMSVSHCGELGWVLYVPNEVAQNVYERIIEHGRQYGLMHAGYYALRQHRIEKFYVYWGQDIHPHVTPVECGRTFRVDFNKDFIGKKALLKQMEYGVGKKYVQLLVSKHDLAVDPWPQGGEIIYRDDKPVGKTTSAAYGFTLNCQVCIGYVENEQFGVSPEFLETGKYEIDIAGKRFPVKVNQRSPTLPMISSEHPEHYRPTQHKKPPDDQDSGDEVRS